MNIKKMIVGILLVGLLALLYYLFRPLSIPTPAVFTCHTLEEGSFMHRDSLPLPSNIYGMGLTYSKHLEETAAEFDPDALPPIFRKKLHSITGPGSKVSYPSTSDIIQETRAFDPQAGDKLSAEFEEISALLDYEVELGVILLEDISATQLKDEAFIPSLGFFVSNDLSARSLGLMGEGTDSRYEFWGLSKSFPGFLPLAQQIWIPHQPKSNSIPCIKLETYVNGELRQSESTDNMIYTPLEMLRFIQKKYPDTSFQKGDMVLTGTPGGVAIATPRVLVRLSNLLGFDRYRKLGVKLGGDQSAFLKAGDRVEVKGEGLGSVMVEITE
ncbi:MAG: fumarylacetoacetate hydrolase family protein [Bacteroidota bacterium]